MPADYSGLQATLAALQAQAATTEITEDNAVALINGFAASVTAAVTAALTADNAADQGSIDTVVASIEAERARFAASAQKLVDAVNANPGPPVTTAKK